MEIRLAQLSDSQDLADIMAATFHLACPKDSERQLQSTYIANHFSAQHFNQWLQSKGYKIWAATENEQVVGLAVLEFVENDHAILSKLYVLPDFHGKGIAVRLYETLLRDAKSQQLQSLLLYVYSENLRAKAFYEKQGFKLMKTDQFEMESEVHIDHVYVLSLVSE